MNQTAQEQPGDVVGFLEAMGASGTPLLGHMVLYSVFEGTITPDQLEGWFRELGLDQKFLPGPIRAVDAFGEGHRPVRHPAQLRARRTVRHRRWSAPPQAA